MVKKLRITIGALLAVLLLAAVGLVAFLYLRSEQVENVQTFQEELRSGLVASCQKNGNPLREAVQRLLEEQIKSSSNLDLLEHFFPQIPRSELIAVTRKQVVADKRLLRKIAPLDCDKLYPQQEAR